jgi:hypothetical protein
MSTTSIVASPFMPIGKAISCYRKTHSRRRRIRRLQIAFGEKFPEREGASFKQIQLLVDQILRVYATYVECGRKEEAAAPAGNANAFEDAFWEVHEAFSGMGFRTYPNYSDYLNDRAPSIMP